MHRHTRLQMAWTPTVVCDSAGDVTALPAARLNDLATDFAQYWRPRDHCVLPYFADRGMLPALLPCDIRQGSALVNTLETGSNKFRDWTDEKVVYFLGQTKGGWKIVGLFIRDASNPE